jgi:hypothetical protein
MDGDMMIPRKVTDGRDIWRRFRRRLAVVVIFFTTWTFLPLAISIRAQVDRGTTFPFSGIIVDCAIAMVLFAADACAVTLLIKNHNPKLARRLAGISIALMVVGIGLVALRVALTEERAIPL